jgi:hypothetical protein
MVGGWEGKERGGRCERFGGVICVFPEGFKGRVGLRNSGMMSE